MNINLFAQRVKIDTIDRWKAYEIVFLIIHNMSIYNFFQDRVKILHDYKYNPDDLMLDTYDYENSYEKDSDDSKIKK